MTFDQLDLRSLASKCCDEERSRAEAGRGASNACEERERASPRSGAQRWPRSIDGPRAIIPGDIEPAGFDLSRKRRSSTRYANNGHAIMITSSARSRPEEEGGVEGQKFCVHSLSLSLTSMGFEKWILERTVTQILKEMDEIGRDGSCWKREEERDRIDWKLDPAARMEISQTIFSPWRNNTIYTFHLRIFY